MKSKTAPLSGRRWAATHQATVDGVLLPYGEFRRVSSKGEGFYNKDNWPARRFVSALSEWARLNPKGVPELSDVQGWVQYANRAELLPHQKEIVIAATPDELPRGLAMALVGGGYHEAWHTVYSRRKPIQIGEVWPFVKDAWNLLKPGETWAKYLAYLLHWGNLVEDIRIERRGCEEYPGARSRMEALQDLILDQEEAGRAASEHRATATDATLSVVMGTFRDLGLGYVTETQKAAYERYQERSPEGYALVAEGAMRPFLDRAIALAAEDGLGSLWLSMEIVAFLVNGAPEEEGEGQEGDEGDEGQKSEGEGQGQPSPGQKGEGQGQPSPGQGKDRKPAPKHRLYKRGDRAKIKTGPNAGREIEITRAGLPDENGVQKLDYVFV